MAGFSLDDTCSNCGKTYGMHYFPTWYPANVRIGDPADMWCPNPDGSKAEKASMGVFRFYDKGGTTKSTIKQSKECACGIFRGDCEYHK